MPVTPLARRINKLADEVEKHADIPWELGQLSNVLLEQAKAAAPDDAVLAVIQQLTPTSDNRYVQKLDGPTVAAILRQAAESVPDTPPEMPVVSQGGTIMGDIANMQW
jgi:hypothetical protein